MFIDALLNYFNCFNLKNCNMYVLFLLQQLI